MEDDFIPQQALEKIEQIDSADLVVGILANLDQETVATVHEAVRTLHGDLRIVILSSRAISVQAYADSASSLKGPRLTVAPWPSIGPDRSGAPMQSVSTRPWGTLPNPLHTRRRSATATSSKGTFPREKAAKQSG